MKIIGAASERETVFEGVHERQPDIAAIVRSDLSRTAGGPWRLQRVSFYRRAGRLRLGHASPPDAIRHAPASRSPVDGHQGVSDQTQSNCLAVDARSRRLRGVFFRFCRYRDARQFRSLGCFACATRPEGQALRCANQTQSGPLLLSTSSLATDWVVEARAAAVRLTLDASASAFAWQERFPLFTTMPFDIGRYIFHAYFETHCCPGCGRNGCGGRNLV